MKILEEIKHVAKVLTSDELTNLRIEEELLMMLVKDQKHSMTLKAEAFNRIKALNEKQLATLGHRIGA
jgi:hypothetical protein